MMVIVGLMEIREEAERLKGYWDETGLDMHIAVKEDKNVMVKTKHWARNHYVSTDLEPMEIWKILGNLSGKIGRKLIRSEKGPYVYINKLNSKQTQEIFNMMIEELGATRDDISRVWEMKWDIEDAVIP